MLYELQSALRSGHSTETALIRITDEILFKMDNDEVTGLVYVDFRKAFDVINHNLLLKKLSVYGASPDSVAWFRSYLEERRQFVKLGHITSEPRPVGQGAPQGSILSPVLFLLFVNVMPLHVNNSAIDIYADDTTLPLSANWNNITSLTQALSYDLENMEKWSTENKMYLNTEKTKALLVTGTRLQHKLSEETATIKLRLDAKNIDQLSHHKLLGLIIDKDLSFEAHMDELCKKLSKGLGLWTYKSLSQAKTQVNFLSYHYKASYAVPKSNLVIV